MSRAVPRQANVLAAPPARCADDGDCPATEPRHSCVGLGACRESAPLFSPPESRGACYYIDGAFDGACGAASPAAHVYDLGARPWLFPRLVARAADGAARAALASLADDMRADDPRARPTLDAVVAALDALLARGLR